jgi:glucose-6-phosphate isomerase
MSPRQLWDRFKKHSSYYPAIGLSVDLSRMSFPDDYLPSMEARMQRAFAAMAELEAGGMANPDEERMAGHYWLRNPALAPTAEVRREIEQTVAAIKKFAAEVHSGRLLGASGPFKNLLVVGIGGSALGPEFVANALSQPGSDKLEPFFFDNTDPDGMQKVLARIGKCLGQTLCVVISKSGGTQETRNGMLVAQAAYREEWCDFGPHAVAITGVGSNLDELAQKEGWLARFPMWDWIGGRTSETSAVGLLPAALQGFDIYELLRGAKACDEITRVNEVKANPAAQLALMWYYAGNGKGAKDMVVLPYKDRLELFSRYLQQLVMESLGKELDLDGKKVNQGIAVYGNKGSTDQHAYVQQLRDGVNNFFVTFISALRDQRGKPLYVQDGVTSGDFLHGFWLGTRQALHEKGRESISLTITDVSEFSVGVLIALFERAVGFYGSLININAYHQPGVEAGKKAANAVIALQLKIVAFLRDHPKSTVAQISDAVCSDEIESVFRICEHLAANPTDGRTIKKTAGATFFDATYEVF